MQKKDPTENKHQLSHLFERYKKLLKPPQATVEKETLVVVLEIAGITLQAHQVKYSPQSRTLVFTCPSVLRSELRQYHQAILRALSTRLGAANAPQTII